MAFIVWCQYLGPSIFLTLFNTIFDTKLTTNLHKYAPDTNATLVLEAGATGFRGVITPAQVPGVLKAYSDSLDIVFYMVMAVSIVCFLTGWGMGFNDIRKTKQVTDEAAARHGGSGSDNDNDNDNDNETVTEGEKAAVPTGAPAVGGEEKQRSDGSETDH